MKLRNILVLLLSIMLLASCEMDMNKQFTEEEANALFDIFIKSLDFDELIDDMIQTHREVGDYAKAVNGGENLTDEDKANRIAEFERENVGTTGIADYYQGIDFGTTSIISLGLELISGQLSAPILNPEGKDYSRGIQFRHISFVTDKSTSESGKAEHATITLDLVFTEDYKSGLGGDETGLMFKSGSELFVSFDCDVTSFELSGVDEIDMTVHGYTLSTVDPNVGNEDLEANPNPAGLVISDGENEYKVHIEGLSGSADGRFAMDTQKDGYGTFDFDVLAVKTTVTINGLELPVYGGEEVTINDVPVDTESVLSASTTE